MTIVVGWCDCWTSPYNQVPFTTERREALIHRIKKRNYNFNYSDHQTLPFCAPFYNDGVICALTNDQWNSVMNEVYKDIPRGARKMPIDVINQKPINDVLWEKEKFYEQYGKGGEQNE